MTWPPSWASSALLPLRLGQRLAGETGDIGLLFANETPSGAGQQSLNHGSVHFWLMWGAQAQ